VAKTQKTRKITVKQETVETPTFFLYRIVDNERKYIGSFTKTFIKNVMRLGLPNEAWTWKRDTATGFRSLQEARGFKKLVDPWNMWSLRIEELVLVEEY